MFCSKCGSELKPNTKFCTKCGCPVKVNVSNSSDAASSSKGVSGILDTKALEQAITDGAEKGKAKIKEGYDSLMESTKDSREQVAAELMKKKEQAAVELQIKKEQAAVELEKKKEELRLAREDLEIKKQLHDAKVQADIEAEKTKKMEKIIPLSFIPIFLGILIPYLALIGLGMLVYGIWHAKRYGNKGIGLAVLGIFCGVLAFIANLEITTFAKNALAAASSISQAINIFNQELDALNNTASSIVSLFSILFGN